LAVLRPPAAYEGVGSGREELVTRARPRAVVDGAAVRGGVEGKHEEREAGGAAEAAPLRKAPREHLAQRSTRVAVEVLRVQANALVRVRVRVRVTVTVTVTVRVTVRVRVRVDLDEAERHLEGARERADRRAHTWHGEGRCGGGSK